MAREGLQKVGLVNHAGEAPVLLSKGPDKNNPRLTVWEFDPCGIPLNEWEDRQARIETALDTNEMQRGAAEKIGGFMETVTAKPEPEPPDPPEESRCKVIPFERVG